MASSTGAANKPVPDADPPLGEVVAQANPTTIDAVLARLEALDAALPANDGLRWFNVLYRMVTGQVRNSSPNGAWQSPAWLDQLDVNFAGLYFDAIRTWTTARETSVENQAGRPEATPVEPVPSSWKVFFEQRFAGGIDRIQFAVAGMNAHINHDLALALLKTDAEFGIAPGADSPERRDYQAVNVLLKTLMPQVLNLLAGDVLGELAQDTGKVGRLLAFWDICRARDLAWDFADQLRGLPSSARDAALAIQDGLTGALGGAILAQV
jgi:hypothetical protein